ncbi:MAG TPA: 2'-5' RNA ligase family protein [Conexibacter sp.]
MRDAAEPARSPAPPPDRRNAAPVRLFAALELPDAVRTALIAWRSPVLRGADSLHAVAPASLHVTLAFLGWKPEEAIAPLAELVEASAAGGGAAGLALGEPLSISRLA